MKISFAKGTACALLGLLPALPSAFAQSPTTTPALGSVKAGDYKVEGYHTQVEFSVLHFGFTDFSGLFAGASGTLKLDPAQISTSKLEVTIPMQSVITTVSKLNDELKGEKWFDVAKFPSATFSSTKVSSTSKGELLISGNLTLQLQLFLPIPCVRAHVTEKASELLLLWHTPIHLRIYAAMQRPRATRSPALLEVVEYPSARE